MQEADGQPAGRKAFFFDRDGTLIHDAGYLHDPELVELLPGVADTLLALHGKGALLFLFTNQSGVGRGYFTMEAVNAVNARMCELTGKDFAFDGVCIAPEHPDEPSLYRKPSPKYILEVIEQYSLNPKNCFVIGDRARDLESGINAGINAVRYSGDIDDPKAACYAEEKGCPSIDDFRKLLSIGAFEPTSI